jgi:hypothetical protein
MLELRSRMDVLCLSILISETAQPAMQLIRDIKHKAGKMQSIPVQTYTQFPHGYQNTMADIEVRRTRNLPPELSLNKSLIGVFHT